ncbi:MBL fold metallo-hydrolase [Mycobacterium sp.]|uniref:MBL fold metallo-hydrolase n=1 Tax=Mycobacterium sp. TaxID=1785 RepID=UPI003C71E006
MAARLRRTSNHHPGRNGHLQTRTLAGDPTRPTRRPLTHPRTTPLRYTPCYLIAADPGLIGVDAGWDSEDGWRALATGLSRAGAMAVDVTGVVATHVHPDHHGMSGRARGQACSSSRAPVK